MTRHLLQRLLTVVILSISVLSTIKSYAQINGPIISAGKVDIKFDESGKVIILPGSAILKGCKYDLTITVAAPSSKHKKLIAAIIDKLDSTYYKLENTSDYQYSSLYAYLWGEAAVKSIKDQIIELSDILKAKDPKSALTSSASDFPMFISKKFLLDNLFGDNFTVTSSIEKASHTGPFDSDISFTVQNVSATDTLQIDVFVEDLEKNFYKALFTESRKKVANELDKLKPGVFYAHALKFNRLKETFLDIRRQVELEPAKYICDGSLISKYEEAASLFEMGPKLFSLPPAESNDPFAVNFLGELKKGWLQNWLIQWMWTLKGNITINPLAFTDRQFLYFLKGYDISKANAYDEYRESALKLMKSSPELNDAKINFAAYDSLLQQKGMGKQVFGYDSRNKTLLDNNTSNAAKAQKIAFIITTLKLPAIGKEQEDSIVFRYFDASAKLAGSKAKDIPTIPTKYQVVAVIHNISDKESFSIKESSTETPNQSEAITQLNTAADGVSDLFSKAGPLPAILSNVLLSFRNPDNFIPSRSVLEDVVVIGAGQSKLKVNDYFIRSSLLDDKFNVSLIDYKRKAVTENLLPEIRRLFYKYNESCDYLFSLYMRKIDALDFKVKVFRNKSYPDIRAEFNKVKSVILFKADSISMSMATVMRSFEKSVILKQLDTYIAISDLISSPEFFTLPPKSYDAKDPDTDNPKYRNEFYTFGEEKKSVEKSNLITLSNSETKKEIKVTDSYFIAPSQRMTYSLGLAYVFGPFRRSEVTVADNKITNAADEEQVRVLLALHYHLKKIILKDDRPIWKLSGDALKSRLSIMVGLSFPKPLYNPHVGVAADIWTGVKVSTGLHFYRFTDYSILNGQISDQHSKYVYNGTFTAINIDPATFVKFLSSSIFK